MKNLVRYREKSHYLDGFGLGVRCVKCPGGDEEESPLEGKVFRVSARTIPPRSAVVESVWLQNETDSSDEYQVKRASFAGWLRLPSDQELARLLRRVAAILVPAKSEYANDLFVAYCHEVLLTSPVQISSLADLRGVIAKPKEWRRVHLETRIKFEISQLV